MKINLKLKPLFSYRKATSLIMSLCGVFLVACQSSFMQINIVEQKTSQVSQIEKQKQAEETVDKLMQRFYETLYFETIRKEGFVSNEKLRRREVETNNFIGLSMELYRAEDTADYESREHAYIADGNYFFTMSAHEFTADKENIKRATKEAEKEFEDPTGEAQAIPKTTNSLNKRNEIMNRMSAVFRKNIFPKNCNTEEYKNKIKEWENAQPLLPKNTENVRKNFIPAGLDKDAEIYAVEREIFCFYLIEENGSMKILSILLRRL